MKVHNPEEQTNEPNPKTAKEAAFSVASKARSILEDREQIRKLQVAADQLDIDMEEQIDKFIHAGLLKPGHAYATEIGTLVIYFVSGRNHCMIYKNG